MAGEFDDWLQAHVLGNHALMKDLRAAVGRAASEDHPVLLEGETGTGKDWAAEAIHAGSRRSGRSLEVVAVGGLGDTAWSVLFGHSEGAFTSATAAHEGVFKVADGSSLIVEDVSDLPRPVQPMLLRAVERGRFRPLGAKREVVVDVRVLSTTNKPLLPLIEADLFRRDLYERLSVLRIEVPPLRAHIEDIVIYVPHFLKKAAKPGTPPKVVSDGAMNLLYEYRWPGNIRELDHALTRASVNVQGPEIGTDFLARILRTGGKEFAQGRIGRGIAAIPPQLLRSTLQAARGNKRETARRLRISPGTVYRLIALYGIEPVGFDPCSLGNDINARNQRDETGEVGTGPLLPEGRDLLASPTRGNGAE